MRAARTGWQYCRVTMARFPQAQAQPGGKPPARWRAGLPLVAGVLLGHAALLALWPSAPGAGTQGDTSRPLQVQVQVQVQVRQITPPQATPHPTPHPPTRRPWRRPWCKAPSPHPNPAA